MAPECQEKNLKSLTMVAVGVNKSAEQYLLLDEETKDELARGKYHDQRRGSFGTSVPLPGRRSRPAEDAGRSRYAGPAAPAPRPAPPARPRPAPREVPRPWTKSQEKLALLYNEQGRRPDEIADKLGLSTYLVTQIILTSRNRGKLLPDSPSDAGILALLRTAVIVTGAESCHYSNRALSGPVIRLSRGSVTPITTSAMASPAPMVAK